MKLTEAASLMHFFHTVGFGVFLLEQKMRVFTQRINLFCICAKTYNDGLFIFLTSMSGWLVRQKADDVWVGMGTVRGEIM